jgi:hypothetical protein
MVDYLPATRAWHALKIDMYRTANRMYRTTLQGARV